MKILVNTYDTAFQNVAGGVHSRIVKTVETLRNAGITVDYFDKFKTRIEDYDILQVFMLDVTNFNLINYAKDKGLKVVLSAVVTVGSGKNIDFYWRIRKLPIMTTYKLLFQEARMVDAIIAETETERAFICEHYHVPKNKVYVVPNGADEIATKSRKIFDAIGRECAYALEVARFDPNKNQMNVIKALKNTDTEVVFIGGGDFTAPEYYNRCVEEAGGAPNIHFIGWLDAGDELLQSAFVNAKVLISSSYHETFGLTIIEGIMAGATPAISRTLPILDYTCFKECITFVPSDIQDIKRQVEKAMKQPKDENLMNEVRKTFSWLNIADEYMDIYRNVSDDIDSKS